jgi:hypothetical protein
VFLGPVDQAERLMLRVRIFLPEYFFIPARKKTHCCNLLYDFLNAFSRLAHHFFLVNLRALFFQGGDMGSRANHPDFFSSKSRHTSGDLSW